MANLPRLEALLCIQLETPNNPPKLKELGYLKLEIIAALLDLLGYPLESSMWAFVLRAADGELEEGVINEGYTPPISPQPYFPEFGYHSSHKCLVLVQNSPETCNKRSLNDVAK